MIKARVVAHLLLAGLLVSAAAPLLSGCLGARVASSAPALTPTATIAAPPPTGTPVPPPTATPTVAGTATPTPIPVSQRGFVPAMCYHHIRDWVKSDTKDDRAYIVPLAKFDAELKYLKDNSYTGVDARQVYRYYAFGQPLPPRPVLLSFDDNDVNQYTNALPLLKKYGFTATFFIMTVTLDKENYMTSDDLRELDAGGFDIEPHTWDHHIVTEYKTGEDWQKQIAEPKATLEVLLGHPTEIFAYPFGIYNAAAVEKIKSYGYKAAFRLRDNMDDTVEPLFAIKRYVANGYWTMHQFALALEGEW